jgi:hypothetical protein
MAGVTTLLAPPILRFLFRNVEPEPPAPDALEAELRETHLG